MHENDTLRALLQAVKNGTVSVDDALSRLREPKTAELGYATVDLERKARQGESEVIYGAGKTPEQIRGIVNAMREHGQSRLLVTRLSPEKAEALADLPDFAYAPEARVGVCGGFPAPDGLGAVVIATGGTSDIPVAEEAALTAAFYGNRVERLYDVGVAGLHRLLSAADTLQNASVVIAVAGMEGALASVIGGLVRCPVIAVPTSVGYGAAFGGLAALLGMLSACAAGIGVVNIDNGFGAATLASRINHTEAKQ